MKKYLLATAILLAAVPAFADDIPDVVARPDDATIRAALLEGYRRNGNSMVGMGSIDVTQPEPAPKADRLFPDKGASPIPQMIITDEKVENILDRASTGRRSLQRRAEASNICTRHGLRKVTTGRSWRCR